jgi:hypothetical protein
MTKHCNGYNMRRWMVDNIVFIRGGPSAAEGKIVYEQVA